jgi:hypothetical protein
MTRVEQLRRYRIELLWGAFAALNYAAMIAWPSWETIPFHFVWISLTLLYGFRVWPLTPTLVVLAGVMLMTGLSIGLDAFSGLQLWGELFEVPLMAAMFLAMVWHARRRVDALAIAEGRAEQRQPRARGRARRAGAHRRDRGASARAGDRRPTQLRPDLGY